MPQRNGKRSVIDPRYYRPDPAPLSKAERQKPKPMTTKLPEQKELDAFYAGKVERLSVAVLDRLFDSRPYHPFARESARKPKFKRMWGEWQKSAAKASRG